MDKRERRVTIWAGNLTADEMRSAFVGLVCYAIDAEMVSFGDKSLAPHWSADGEPLVEGQSIYPDEE